MLISALRTGISTDLKIRAAFKFSAFADFDRLRVELRRSEEEMSRDSPQVCKSTPQSASSHQPPSNSDAALDKLTGMVHQLQNDMTAMNKRFASEQEETSNESPRYRGSFRGRGRGRQWRPRREWQQPEPQPVEPDLGESDIICYRCGQAGHIAIGCRVDLDRLPQPPRGGLNSRRLMRRGRS